MATKWASEAFGESRAGSWHEACQDDLREIPAAMPVSLSWGNRNITGTRCHHLTPVCSYRICNTNKNRKGSYVDVQKATTTSVGHDDFINHSLRATLLSWIVSTENYRI